MQRFTPGVRASWSGRFPVRSAYVQSRQRKRDASASARESTATEDADARATGLLAGRYRLQEELGRGGMGSVFRALDEGTGRSVALKLLRSPQQAQRQLFRREFQTLAKLVHPCVIRVFDHGADDAGHLYYTMELLAGRDLAAAAPLPWRVACEALRDVATSLALLHSQKLVHRDINPRNVRLSDEGRAKLLDFGALSPFGIPSELVGTPTCIAPEALRGEPLDARADLFSFGVVAYWALTGRIPYAVRSFDDAEMAWRKQPLPPSAHVTNTPAGLDELIVSLLSIEASGRPTSAADVIDRLGALSALDDEPLWSIAESHVSSATLVGRDRELRALEDVLTAASGGHGTLVCVNGESGTGKTRLLRELVIQAQLKEFATIQLAADEHCEVEALLQKLVVGLRECAPRETLASPMVRAPNVARLSGASLSAPAEEAAASSGDRFEHERPLRAQLEVARLVAQVASQRALLITIDDADKLSGPACALLPILAQTALDHTLVVAATRASVASDGNDPLKVLGEAIALSDLDEAALDSLLQNIFGDAPNRARVGAWLQRSTSGNPGRVRDALLHLLDKRIVRYGGGAWLLPSELSEVQLPEAPGAAAASELAKLRAPTRELLRTLALHHGPLSVDVCARVVADLAEALEEAQRRRLVLVDGEGVRVAQTSLRDELREEVSPTQRSAIHAKLAVAICELYARPFELLRRGEGASLSIDEVVMAAQAGLHLLLSGSERKARGLLRDGAVALTVRGEGLTRAAPALEQAVAFYRAARAPLNRYAGLMTALTLAGTYIDWRLSYRYAEDTLDACADVLGFNWAERLAPWLGKRVAVITSLALAFALFVLLPRRRIADTFKTALLGPIGLGLGAMSVCSVMMDPERADRLAKRLRPLGFFPRNHPFREIYEYQLAIHDHTRGDYAGCRARSVTALAYLRSQAAIKAFPESARLQLEGGILIALGQLDACRTDGAIEETLQDVGSVQTATTQQSYAATAMSMYANRGERQAYLKWRERTDQLAATSGATWRNDVQVPRMIWSTHALCGDVLTLKRDMEQLRSLALEVPTVARLRDIFNACYLCERGRPDEALARYESVFQVARTATGVRAVQQLGAYARILRKAGRAEEALQVCEAAVARLSPADLEFTLLVFGVQVELALSLTMLGQNERAKHTFAQLFAAHAAHDNPMLHGLLHVARAELALAERDWTSFEEHEHSAQAWLTKTQHPALMAQYQRLVERGRTVHNEQTLKQVLAGQAVIAFGTTAPGPGNDVSFETEDVV